MPPSPVPALFVCDAMARRFQASGYHARAVHVSLSPWVEASGTRVYIFLVDARVFGIEVVEDAVRSVNRQQAQRTAASPWPLEASCDHGALGSWAPAACDGASELVAGAAGAGRSGGMGAPERSIAGAVVEGWAGLGSNTRARRCRVAAVDRA